MNRCQLRRSFLAFYFALTCQAEIKSQPVEWPIASGGNGYWYEAVFDPDAITWEASAAAAVSKGGYLATATSLAENEFIFELVSDPKFWQLSAMGTSFAGPYLGGFQPAGSPEPAGNWQWVTGEPFSYESWRDGEPNNDSGIEDRVHFLSIDAIGPNWNDTHDGFARLGYVVEYDTQPVPEPASAIIAIALMLAGTFGTSTRVS